MYINKLSPVVLFVYNRPWHTQQTIESLKNNELALQSDLIIFSDGPKNEQTITNVQKVREYIKTINGFKSLQIIERKDNFGLANSIIDGVTDVINQHSKIIVVEDDLVTSQFFLQYMNEGLEKYVNDDQVISIHGYSYPTQERLPEAFFLRGADCWGWATWKRGWDLFNPNGIELLDELKKRKLTKEFDFNDSYPYTKMLKNQINGKNDSWAIRWYASAFLADKLTLYPGRSLVHNIGNDNSGRHFGMTTAYDAKLSDQPIDLTGVPIEECKHAKQIIMVYFHAITSKVAWFISQVIPVNITGIFFQLLNGWLPTIIDNWLRGLVRGAHFDRSNKN